MEDSPIPKLPKARPPKKVLTAEEKEEAKAQRAANKVLREKRTEWEASLPPPFQQSSSFKHSAGTLVTFKTDAKRVFGLSERDMETLRYEACPWSIKQYYALADVRALQRRKFSAGALPSMELKGHLRVLETLSSGGHRGKSNFPYAYDDAACYYPMWA
ncbi:hypothetical protein R3P38DRAFT_3305034 [Favolaschia claudopus]|uniref:Uncharacterized protein n=1 Tax=Favolaschia claudopus TaxID=2862362 RepID=A0AAW0DYB4_9AGAR